MARVNKKPRKSDTYRGARRMAVKASKLLDEWRANSLARAKRPLPRKQSKKYPYASTKRDGSVVRLWQAHEHDEAA